MVEYRHNCYNNDSDKNNDNDNNGFVYFQVKIKTELKIFNIDCKRI